MDPRSYPVNFKYWIVLFSVLIASCVSQGELREEHAEPRLDNLVEVQPASPTQPLKTDEDKVLLELTLPQTELVPKKPRDKGPRFSLSAEDVDVKSILFAISREIDQNIMIDPVISKKVTLNLKEVTLKEMLDHVLLPLNLRYEVDEAFIQVIPLEMQTRVFRLNYLISRRQGSGSLQASLQTGAYEPGTARIDYGTPGSSSQIISSEETDLWEEITLGMRQMVANESPLKELPNSQTMDGKAVNHFSEGQAWFSVNKQAGIIVVKSFPEVLLQIAEFLEEVEGSVQRQVLIHARILQVVKRSEFPTKTGGKALNALHSSGSRKSVGVSKAYGGDPQNPDTRLDEIMKALAERGEVSSLASPKVMALNNQRAVIKVGTQDTVFVQDTSHSQPRAEREYIPQPVSLGLVLDVVPQININGNVIMSVRTSVTKQVGERVAPDGSNRMPIVDVRESNNVVLARNGQTVVVGGLTGAEKGSKEESMASLEQVPILGKLFSEDATVYEKSELVILLTPEIMVGDAVEDRLRIEEKRLQRFGLPRQSYQMKTSSEGK
ncbi:MAG: pilus (MSHA type) biogenesis protein MshL [Nitrospinaceae bacterium]|nr:MAG: pilus (MSHA type) biogenesis protein MshL [Nitrospinaceae bacterium]